MEVLEGVSGDGGDDYCGDYAEYETGECEEVWEGFRYVSSWGRYVEGRRSVGAVGLRLIFGAFVEERVV